MFQNLIFVMLGGAVGAALRYLVGLSCAQSSSVEKSPNYHRD